MKITDVCPIILATGGFSIFVYPIIQKLRAINVPNPELSNICHSIDDFFNGDSKVDLFFEIKTQSMQQ